MEFGTLHVNAQHLIAKAQELIMTYGMRALGALVILILGRFAAGILRGILRKIMVKAKVEATLVSFVTSVAYVAMMAFIIIAALGQLGVQTASFVAILGAAGLAVGLALQGSLANFAAGVLMIVFKPFRVGDYIEAGGVQGTVRDIGIFTTELLTPDNKKIIVPNAKTSGDNIVNYSATGTRRVDLVVGVSYEDNLDQVRNVLCELLAADMRILKDPAPYIGVANLGESSVEIAVRPWVNADDYWDVFFETQENIKKRFDAEGISIPFPQRDIHMKKAE